MKRYQFTAINATRIRALRIYQRHDKESTIDFMDYVVERFHFRIHTIRTDNWHEWQARFHWHVEDLGIHHVYIKPGKPNLNGKVERSHLTDQLEFYQLLDYTGDVGLPAKLAGWEDSTTCSVHTPRVAEGRPTRYSGRSCHRDQRQLRSCGSQLQAATTRSIANCHNPAHRLQRGGHGSQRLHHQLRESCAEAR